MKKVEAQLENVKTHFSEVASRALSSLSALRSGAAEKLGNHGKWQLQERERRWPNQENVHFWKKRGMCTDHLSLCTKDSARLQSLGSSVRLSLQARERWLQENVSCGLQLTPAAQVGLPAAQLYSTTEAFVVLYHFWRSILQVGCAAHHAHFQTGRVGRVYNFCIFGTFM